MLDLYNIYYVKYSCMYANGADIHSILKELEKQEEYVQCAAIRDLIKHLGLNKKT